MKPGIPGRRPCLDCLRIRIGCYAPYPDKTLILALPEARLRRRPNLTSPRSPFRRTRRFALARTTGTNGAGRRLRNDPAGIGLWISQRKRREQRQQEPLTQFAHQSATSVRPQLPCVINANLHDLESEKFSNGLQSWRRVPSPWGIPSQSEVVVVLDHEAVAIGVTGCTL